MSKEENIEDKVAECEDIEDVGRDDGYVDIEDVFDNSGNYQSAAHNEKWWLQDYIDGVATFWVHHEWGKKAGEKSIRQFIISEYYIVKGESKCCWRKFPEAGRVPLNLGFRISQHKDIVKRRLELKKKKSPIAKFVDCAICGNEFVSTRGNYFCGGCSGSLKESGLENFLNEKAEVFKTE